MVSQRSNVVAEMASTAATRGNAFRYAYAVRERAQRKRVGKTREPAYKTRANAEVRVAAA